MHSSNQPRPLRSAASGALKGTISVPGDKSISHRALIFGALAVGETRVSGMLEGEDVLRTADVLRHWGAHVERVKAGEWRIHGVGVGGLSEPDNILDCGNSGTGARLLMGLAASHDFNSVFTGDASLRRRPMARVTEPLGRMGARFICRRGERLPITVIGAETPLPIEYRLPVASAQVKSAILLAGLNTPGKTTVIEPERTRDHSENMLRFFGAEVEITDLDDKARRITLTGQPELKSGQVQVPGDPSSAAFPLLAAAIVPGSDVLVKNVGINPLRTGLFATLREMGADIAFENERDAGGEPVADIRVRHAKLRGVTVPPERAPSMIDEYPVLAAIASFANGKTIVRGAKELRVKESDRISAMARGLITCGVDIEELEDGFIVNGMGRPPKGGAAISTEMDHRIAMSFLVLGLGAEKPVDIDDAAMIDTSFPGFAALMQGLGAKIENL